MCYLCIGCVGGAELYCHWCRRACRCWLGRPRRCRQLLRTYRPKPTGSRLDRSDSLSESICCRLMIHLRFDLLHSRSTVVWGSAASLLHARGTARDLALFFNANIQKICVTIVCVAPGRSQRGVLTSARQWPSSALAR